MLLPSYAKQFKKDYKKLALRDSGLVDAALGLLIEEGLLPERYRDKKLRGEWQDYRECHPRPDLIVIYKKIGSEIAFVRVGSHAELYG